MGKARLLSASRRSIKQRRRQTPDDVFSRYSKKVSDLQIDMIDEDLILIEGSAATFRFLAELFGAMADDDSDCGTQFFPKGPAGRLFSEKSKFGFYLHRLPCLNHPAKAAEAVSEVEKGTAISPKSDTESRS